MSCNYKQKYTNWCSLSTVILNYVNLYATWKLNLRQMLQSFYFLILKYIFWVERFKSKIMNLLISIFKLYILFGIILQRCHQYKQHALSGLLYHAPQYRGSRIPNWHTYWKEIYGSATVDRSDTCLSCTALMGQTDSEQFCVLNVKSELGYCCCSNIWRTCTSQLGQTHPNNQLRLTYSTLY